MTGADKERSYNGDYMEDGRIAEQIVMTWLRRNSSVIGVDDWRELQVVREADVDCAVKLRDGRVRLAEIKSDKHLGVSGNVLFEVLRINHTCMSEKACVLGWSARSPATYFLYYAPEVKAIYVCRPDDLRSAFQNYTKNARKKTALCWVDTDRIKSTLNVLIPWEQCKQVFQVYDVHLLVEAILASGGQGGQA